ncbi:MAG: hypothetical protein FWE04_08490 [Oscillospiraceae bacterium]|nr:hypothetical protein [Oscillospiraceae bacterium]
MRNDIFDKKLENLIDAAAPIAVEQLDLELSESEEDVAFSPEFESNMAKLFANEKASKPAPVSKSRSASGGRFQIFSKYVATAAVVMLFLATAAVVVIQGVNEGNDDVAGGVANMSGSSVEIGDLYMTYVPYGFELYEKDTENGRIFARFARDDLYFKINVDESRDDIEVTGNVYEEKMERILYNATMICC